MVTYADLPLFLHPTAPHNGTETSRDAAKSIKLHAGRMAKQVLHCISSSPNGLTCEQVEQQLEMKHQTASARIRDLASCQPPLICKRHNKEGKLIRRETTSGRTAAVWFLTEDNQC